jgi:hypothetical protein
MDGIVSGGSASGTRADSCLAPMSTSGDVDSEYVPVDAPASQWLRWQHETCSSPFTDSNTGLTLLDITASDSACVLRQGSDETPLAEDSGNFEVEVGNWWSGNKGVPVVPVLPLTRVPCATSTLSGSRKRNRSICSTGPVLTPKVRLSAHWQAHKTFLNSHL